MAGMNGAAGERFWRTAPWVSFVALLLAWEGLARSGLVTPFMLPAFSVVVERIGSDAMSGDLLDRKSVV